MKTKNEETQVTPKLTKLEKFVLENSDNFQAVAQQLNRPLAQIEQAWARASRKVAQHTATQSNPKGN